jgi:AraC-like DNA-binding protein
MSYSLAHSLVSNNAPPESQNAIDFSSYKKLYSAMKFKSFGIKYVSDGCEHYTVSGHKYTVQKGQYLFVNHYHEGFVEIESEYHVKGICIDLDPNIVKEVLACQQGTGNPMPDTIDFDNFFNTANDIVCKCEAEQTHVGRFLHNLHADHVINPFSTNKFSKEFYYTMAEHVLADYIPMCKQLQSIPAIKGSTKSDLLRRLYIGKNYIEENYIESFSVASIASECGLSEYYFFRLFRVAFGVTPQKYILMKRLLYGKHLIFNKGTSISEAALLCGFSDIYAFSKAFKIYFGSAPTKFLEP